MGKILLQPDFKDLLRLLNSNRVEYLVVGGYAVGYFGYPRATGDLDIWVAVNPANARKIVAALDEFGIPQEGLAPEIFLEKDKIIRMGMPPSANRNHHRRVRGGFFRLLFPQRVD